MNFNDFYRDRLTTSPVCEILGIEYPIIQGGMVWCSGWRLASAVSNEGGLGVIGAGSMHPDNFLYHIQQCKAATDKPFGVNIPLIYPELDAMLEIVINQHVPVVITSAGSPKKWTSTLKEHGIKVMHVVSSREFAIKCEEAGVDIVIAEGFEAGGHNGREETTTFCLVPSVRQVTSIPLVAAGGIATKEQVMAALVLGADGVQIGTRFALCEESSAHENFKNYCRGLREGGTKLLLKKMIPTRLAENEFSSKVIEAEDRGASKEELIELLGKGRAKSAIFAGDLSEGEIEIGQVATLVKKHETVKDIFRELKI